MSNTEVIAQRTYQDGQGSFTVGIRAPYQNGDEWVCELFTKGLDAGNVPVTGVDALQAIRLALSMLDALVETRPEAEAQGIKGVF